MRNRIICLILSLILLVGLVPVGALDVSAVSEMQVSDECISLLKEMEGFSAKPYWDNGQWTVGYGTRCPSEEDRARYEQEGISREEAEALLRSFISNMCRSINSFATKYELELTQNQFDALLLFTYNCGNAWMFQSGFFRNAVISGATGNDFIYAITLWCNVNSQINYGLVNRRLAEANIYLNGVYSRSAPSNYCYVIYDANGGKVNYRIHAYDAHLTAEPDVALRDGYTFAGWYTSPAGGTKVTKLDASTKSLTLYARWATADGEEIPEEPEQQEPAMGTVTGSDLRIRSGPGTGYSILGWMNKGDRVEILEQQRGGGMIWGRTVKGWISMSYVKLDEVVVEPEDTTPPATEPSEPETEPSEPETEPSEPETKPIEPETKPSEPETKPSEPETIWGTVIGSDLRIRTGPGTGYSILGWLQIGDRVEILEQKTVGSMVWGRYEKGWISLTYVRLDEIVEEPSEPETEPSEPETEPSEPETEPSEPETEPSEPETEPSEPETEPSEPETEPSEPETEPSEPETEPSEPETEPSEPETEPSEPETEPEDDTITGSVRVNDCLRIRSGAGFGYGIVGYLGDGAKVVILETKLSGNTTWGRIDKGWISLDYVEIDSTGSDETVTMTVIADCLHLRDGAGTNYPIVGFLYEGAKVEILETTTVNGTKWGRTVKGWVCMNYVQ